jgi:predicted ATPase
MVFNASFDDDDTAIRSGYSVETGLAPSYQVEIGLGPPAAAGFTFEPHIKVETLAIDSGRRPVEMMDRLGPAVFARDDSGRRVEHPVKLLDSETTLAILGSSGRYPEIGDLCATVLGWRFYHGFRTDRDSPIRQPSLAITAPLLDEDGRNLAAVFATLVHIREDTVDLDRCLPMHWAGGHAR